MRAALRCPACQRKLAQIPLLRFASEVFKRKCPGCGRAWTLIAEPISRSEQAVVHRLTWTARNHRKLTQDVELEGTSACECSGGQCSGAGPHGQGEDDACPSTSTSLFGLIGEPMTAYLCAPCGGAWVADGDWRQVGQEVRS